MRKIRVRMYTIRQGLKRVEHRERCNENVKNCKEKEDELPYDKIFDRNDGDVMHVNEHENTIKNEPISFAFEEETKQEERNLPEENTGVDETIKSVDLEKEDDAVLEHKELIVNESVIKQPETIQVPNESVVEEESIKRLKVYEVDQIVDSFVLDKVDDENDVVDEELKLKNEINKNQALTNKLEHIKDVITEAKHNLGDLSLVKLNSSINLLYEKYLAEIDKQEKKQADFTKQHELIQKVHTEELERINNENTTKINEIERNHQINNEAICDEFKRKEEISRKEAESLQTEVKKTYEELLLTKEAMKTKDREISEIQNDLDEKKGDIEYLKLEIHDLTKQNAINCDNLDFIKSENDSLKKKAQHAMNLKKEAKSNLRALREKVEDVDIGEFKMALLRIQEDDSRQIKQLRQENGDLQIKVKQMTSEWSKASESFGIKIKQLDEQNKENNLSLEKRTNELEQEVVKLQEENTSLRIANNNLNNAKNELKEEFNIKMEYVTELDSAMVELQKSNKYYQEQLIKSDKLIQELKSNKISIDFSTELEKIKRKHSKEIALLKLQIEENENN